MKKLLLFIIVVFIALGSQAEEVYVSVAMPTNSTLDSNTKSILKTKLLNIASAEGVGSMECGAIALVPQVDILNKELVEGGMRNITSLEVAVTITVRNIITDAVFNTVTISSKGNGYSETEAMRSAINQIAPDKFLQFIRTAKSKIVAYYQNNTASLITKAKTLANQQLYDEALATLSSYPESLKGYPQVAATISSIFKKAQTQYCKEILQAARAAYAQRDFEGAAELTSTIDATSSCAPEAQKLLNSIKRNKDQEYQNQIENERQKRRSRERIATATIRAARDIAVAYFKRQDNYVFFW